LRGGEEKGKVRKKGRGTTAPVLQWLGSDHYALNTLPERRGDKESRAGERGEFLLRKDATSREREGRRGEGDI